MRPATPTSDSMTRATDASSPLKPRRAAWLVTAVVAVAAARFAGVAVASNRCVSAARGMTVHTAEGTSSVARELGRLAPTGHWETGVRGADGSRPIVYRGGPGADAEWEWSCRDEESLPSFVAVSPAARKLTPERSFE